MIFEVFNQNSKYYSEMMNVILKAKNTPPEKGQIHLYPDDALPKIAEVTCDY